jgi:hypothetical protein
MATVALTGKDTHKANGRILSDFAPGDCVVIEFDGDLVNSKRGKNGNTIHALNESGKLAKATYRVLTGSADDKFFQNLLSSTENDFSQASLILGESIKRMGNGGGNINPVTYSMSGGVIKKKPGMKDNSDGDIEQAITTWEVTYADVTRTIG